MAQEIVIRNTVSKQPVYRTLLFEPTKPFSSLSFISPALNQVHDNMICINIYKYRFIHTIKTLLNMYMRGTYTYLLHIPF